MLPSCPRGPTSGVFLVSRESYPCPVTKEARGPHPSLPHPASPAGLLPPNPPGEWGPCVRELSPPAPPRLFLATSRFSGFYAAASVGISWSGQKRTEDQQAGRYLGSSED